MFKWDDRCVLGYIIYVTCYVRVGILIVLGYACYLRELVVHNPRSLHGGLLDPDGGQDLCNGVLHDYRVDEVPVSQRLFAGVALVLIGPLVDAL